MNDVEILLTMMGFVVGVIFTMAICALAKNLTSKEPK